MKYSLCAFPLIGAVIALLMAGAGIVMDLQGFPPLVRGAVFCLIPFAVTGPAASKTTFHRFFLCWS